MSLFFGYKPVRLLDNQKKSGVHHCLLKCYTMSVTVQI